ncbi:MAG: hypothetical protein LBG27_09505 [Spirochaetaceae bacterium]|nr:hypothetical protein [Spirochaetaceae bacterium]
MRSGTEEHTFEGHTLNKNVLSAYQDDPSLTAGQNERTRRYVTAVGVWTALVLYHDSLKAEAESQGSVNGNWFQTGGAVEAAGNALVNAVEIIMDVGVKILTYADKIFAGATTVVATVGAAIGVTISAPIVATIAVASVLIATVVVLAEMSTANDEEANNPEEPPELPLEERTALRLKIWYEDEAGERRLIPVIREGNSPQTADKFFIKPHGTGYSTDASAVRFYMEWSRIEQVDDSPALKFELSPDFKEEGNVYRTLTDGVENDIDYFEISKMDGMRKQSNETTLTIQVHDAAGAGDSPVYYPYYYVATSEDPAGYEKFASAEGFVIHFLDGLTAPAADIRIPKHTVIDFGSTIASALIAPPCKLTFYEDDETYAKAGIFADVPYVGTVIW